MFKKDAHRQLYDSIHDFKSAAELVEAEITRRGITYDSSDFVPGMTGRKHQDTWISMKAVSLFNLGTALELLLKLLLLRNGVPSDKIPKGRDGHDLTKLYDALCGATQDTLRKQLEWKYRSSRRDSADIVKLMFKPKESTTESIPPCPPTSNVNSLRGFLEYLDRDVLMWEKRYTWERVEKGKWHHYLDDISVCIELIDRVMRDIPRN